MSSFGSQPSKDQKPSFWKKNAKNVPGSIKPVYGAQHPPRQVKPTTSAPSTPKKASLPPRQMNDSFSDFAASTEDAWDSGDDDVISMADFRMSKKDVQSTALKVLNNHSQQQKQKCYDQCQNGSQQNSTTSSNSRVDQNRTDSYPTTPPHQKAGPGVGVRLAQQKHAKLSAIIQPNPQCEKDRMQCDKFSALLSQSSIDLDELRDLSWKGVPWQFKPESWKLLAGYIPPMGDRRQLTLQRKRQEYFNFVDQYYDSRLDVQKDTFRQIAIDIPRMSPLIPIFQQKLVQEIFERILFIWAIRHPASGYVQGMNDLVTPFFVVFLSEFISEDIESCDVSTLSAEHLWILESDTFWCFSKLLDSIQDNYLFAQPGIQTKVQVLKDIVTRVNNKLHCHLQSQQVEYLQFSFRWMNNLLTREVPLRCTIRLWDTYLSEPANFSSLHLYVCAAFLLKYADDLLRERDFQGLMLMLQNLPTHNWHNDEINMLLAEAYRLKYSFADAPHHLQQKS